MHVHQIHVTAVCGDAVGNEILEIRNILKKWGYTSNIYVQHPHPETSAMTKHFLEYKKISSPHNILIVHYSIGCDEEFFNFIKSLPDRKILIYHNITPPEYFKDINSESEYYTKIGRQQLRQNCGMFHIALADSEFSRQELAKLGFKNTGVLPIILDFAGYSRNEDTAIIKKFDDDYVNLLFVGRVCPNKKIEDVVKCFYYYNQGINPHSRLFLVGSYNGMEKYRDRLMELIHKINLRNVYLTGRINFDSLISYYRLADVFITMSEHEGFCIPILESMHFGIPVIAYNSTAVPYTLGDSGVLVNNKNHMVIAEIINLLVEDKELKKKIIKKQNERLKYFEKSKTERKLKKYIESVI
jgi:glycosyltransferase involved in cell wall biosynthesis